MSMVGRDVYRAETRILYVNGIMTSCKDAQAKSDEVAELTKVPVELHHNNTTPTERVVDPICKATIGAIFLTIAISAEKKSRMERVLCLVLGILSAGLIADALIDYADIQDRKNASASSLADKIIKHLEQNPLNKITLTCHSQGADVTVRALTLIDILTDQYQSRIDVVTMGGMVTIPNHLANRAIHIQHTKDLVSIFANLLFDPGGEDVVEIASKKCTTFSCHGADDYLAHPTTQQALLEFTQGVNYTYDPTTGFPRAVTNGEEDIYDV